MITFQESFPNTPQGEANARASGYINKLIMFTGDTFDVYSGVEDSGIVQSGTHFPALSGLPLILPSSGTIGNNGALTLTTALPTVYTDAYAYFPANAIWAGSALGMYYVKMSSTTVGVIYANKPQASEPDLVVSPTPLVTTGPGAYTQTINSDITLGDVLIGSGVLQADGQLIVSLDLRAPNNANLKTYKPKLDTTTLFTNTAFLTGKSAAADSHSITSRRSLTSQRNRGLAGDVGGYSTVDMSFDKSLSLIFQIATATDYLVLESFTVEAHAL